MKTEQAIQKQIRDYIKTIGGYSIKTLSMSEAGFPDLIIMIDSMIVFCEVKKEGGKLSELQKNTISKISNQNCNVFVAYSLDDFKNYLFSLNK